MITQTKIRILCVLDTSLASREQVVKDAFNLVNQDYAKGTHNKVALEPTWIYDDLSNLNWIEYGYGKNNYGVDPAWIKKDTVYRQKVYGDSVDCVMYFIDNIHWTSLGDQSVYGWSLMAFYSGFQIQLIRVANTIRSSKLTISMELTHALDNFADVQGKSLEKLFQVSNFDEDIVHNSDFWYNGYKAQLTQIEDVLFKLFLQKEQKFVIIELLKKIVELYRLMIINRKKPQPVVIKCLK